MIIMTVLLTWSVIAVAYFWLGSAQNVVKTLSTEHVPRLMEITSLAERTSELAVLSSRILYTNGAKPAQLDSELRQAVTALDKLLQDAFDTPQTAAQSQELQHQLANVIRSLNRTRQLDAALRSQVERLRWVSVDLQDETAPLAADFSFNIQSLTRNLTQESKRSRRDELAGILQKEQVLYETFIAVENSASIATTLAIQASTSLELDQLTRFSALLSDALSRMNVWLADLPNKAEYLTLQQSTEALNALSVGLTALYRPADLGWPSAPRCEIGWTSV